MASRTTRDWPFFTWSPSFTSTCSRAEPLIHTDTFPVNHVKHETKAGCAVCPVAPVMTVHARATAEACMRKRARHAPAQHVCPPHQELFRGLLTSQTLAVNGDATSRPSTSAGALPAPLACRRARSTSALQHTQTSGFVPCHVHPLMWGQTDSAPESTCVLTMHIGLQAQNGELCWLYHKLEAVCAAPLAQREGGVPPWRLPAPHAGAAATPRPAASAPPWPPAGPPSAWRPPPPCSPRAHCTPCRRVEQVSVRHYARPQPFTVPVEVRPTTKLDPSLSGIQRQQSIRNRPSGAC